jgi:hypothetical protein
MRIRTLLKIIQIISLPLFIIGCKSDEGCDHYFLEKSLMPGISFYGYFYYDEEGLISLVTSDTEHLEFSYENDKIKKINSTGNIAYTLDFDYDGEEMPTSLIQVKPNTWSYDSFAIEYDEAKRIVKQFWYRFEFNEMHPYSYCLIEYPDAKTKKVSNYYIGADEPQSIDTYIFDGKQTPLPIALYFGNLTSMKGLPLGNVIEVQHTDPNNPTPLPVHYSYDYNSAGYPTQWRFGDGTVSRDYFYSCDAPHKAQ